MTEKPGPEPATAGAPKPAVQETKPGASAAPAPRRGGIPVPLVAGAAVSIVAGAALGLFVLGPRLGARPAATERADAEHAAAKPAGGGSHGGGGRHGSDKGSASSFHRIDNLIVNPAGSQGRRFLMLTIAIEVPGAKMESALREKDAMLRDAIIGAVESRTLATITGPGGRDSIRVAITAALEPWLGDVGWYRVYLPQFVLQ